MNPLIKNTALISSLALGCASAFAAGNISGKVLAVEGGQLTLQTSEAAPEWLRQGQSVQALGFPAKVLSVQGNQVVLQSSPSRAAKAKVASDLVLQEISKKERFGC